MNGADHGRDVVRLLAERLPEGLVTIDPEILHTYRTDFAPLCESGTPAALVRARTTDDVARTLAVADEHRIPVVPQGGRTGLSGGANAVDGCVLLNVERMDRIISIDPIDQVAVVQPGVVNATFSKAVAEHHLFYPPDPASWEASTLGGNAATNAGGLCCVKYGVTTDFVRGLEVVLADGRVLRTGRRTVKGVAGYDLTRLFVGSEGTLGVITELTLALVPEAEAPLTAVAFCPDTATACRIVTEHMAAGPRPALLELMDRAAIEAVTAYRDLGFPQGSEAVLITQSDRGDQAPGDLARFAATARTHGADVLVADDPVEAQLLLESRRLLAHALEALGTFLSDDVCVPRSALAELVTGVAEISRTCGLLITCSGHAGDGNMHPSVIFDGSDEDEVRRAHEAFEAVMALGLRLGGTITGEHGVGTLKAGWLARELGPVGLDVHRGVKRLFDPHGILNPGKVLSASGPE